MYMIKYVNQPTINLSGRAIHCILFYSSNQQALNGSMVTSSLREELRSTSVPWTYMEAGQLRRYSGSWRDGRSGDRISVCDIPHPSIPVLGHTQLPLQWVPGLSRGCSGRGTALTTTPHLAPRLKKDYSKKIKIKVMWFKTQLVLLLMKRHVSAYLTIIRFAKF